MRSFKQFLSRFYPPLWPVDVSEICGRHSSSSFFVCGHSCSLLSFQLRFRCARPLTRTVRAAVHFHSTAMLPVVSLVAFFFVGEKRLCSICAFNQCNLFLNAATAQLFVFYHCRRCSPEMRSTTKRRTTSGMAKRTAVAVTAAMSWPLRE